MKKIIKKYVKSIIIVGILLLVCDFFIVLISSNILAFSLISSTFSSVHSFTISMLFFIVSSVIIFFCILYPILLFDDTLSALDVDTEKKVLEEIEKQIGNNILILISNKISMMEKMDKVFLLVDGKIYDIITIINTMYKILLKILYKNPKNKSNRLSTSEVNLV